jgi:branched-chain amino acid transport system substrate-binding protein
MKTNPILPLIALLLIAYGGWTLYQRGQLSLPGLPPVTPTPAPTPTPTPNPVPTPTTTTTGPIQIEPSLFARPELRSVFEASAQKNWAEVITLADAYRRKNPTDALSGLAREEAIAKLTRGSTVSIGVSAPLTGSLRQVGEAFVQGVYLAVKDINDAGGIKIGSGQQKVIVRVLNDAGDRTTAINVASEFVADSNIVGVVGPYSSSTLLASAPIYNAASPGKPIIAPAATNPKITEAGRMIYRVAPSDTTQGAALARLVKTRGAGSVAVLFDEDDAYSLGLADSFKAEAATIGLTTSDFKIKLDQYDAAKVGNYNVDAIFVSGYTSDVAAAARYEKPFGKPIYAGDGAYGQDLVAQGGADVEGVIVTSFWHSTLTDANSVRFTKRFQNLFGGGTPNANAMQAYDAARTLIEAIRRRPQGGNNGEAVRLGLETFKINPGPGITSPVRFDDNGDIVGRPWVAITVENTKFKAIGAVK